MTGDAVGTDEANEFTALEREKTVVLEELIFARSDDISKLYVDEDLLRDFEQDYQRSPVPRLNPYIYKSSTKPNKDNSSSSSSGSGFIDSSKNNFQALSQMLAASSRGHRVRRYPAQLPLATRTSVEKVSQQRQQPKRPPPTRPTPARIRTVLQPPPPDPLEVELTSLTDSLVAQSLANAVKGNALHREASRLVRSALRRVEKRFEDGDLDE